MRGVDTGGTMSRICSRFRLFAVPSRGMPVSPATDARLTPFRDNGRRLFQSRIGQLDLSCASCHDDNWGKRLGGSVIPQAHPNGYTLYRLEWQAVGSLQRRLRNCMIGVRAEPFAFGASEFIDLELYLMERANGLPIETPAVRP
jgi:L-cysteine S-thiosulfotransferase